MISAVQEPWIVGSLADVARFFRVHPDTVRTWRRQGLPGDKGAWNLSAIVAWREGRRRATPEMIPGAAEGRFEADARKATADADLYEMKRDQRRGDLIDVDTVTRVYARHATHARALWEQAPDRLLGLLPATATGDDKRRFRAEATRIIEDVVHAFYTDLLQQENEAPDGSGDETDPT